MSSSLQPVTWNTEKLMSESLFKHIKGHPLSDSVEPKCKCTVRSRLGKKY